MTAALKIEPVKVKTYVDRVESLEKEKQAIGDDVREVYDEAKKAGLNTKALRKIVAKRRAKAPDPQVEAAMHAYELALDEAAAMVSNGDVSLRAATARTGFSKSAIQRQVSHRKRDAVSGTEPPHDADGVTTGASPKPDAETIAWAEKVAAELPREPQSTRPLKDFIAERRAASKITDTSPKAPDASSTVTARATEEEARQEGNGAGRVSQAEKTEAVPAQTVACSTAADIGKDDDDKGACITHTPSGARLAVDENEVQPICAKNAHKVAEAPPTESLGAVARPSSAERVASTINPDEDDLKIPPFLTKAGQRASAPSKEK